MAKHSRDVWCHDCGCQMVIRSGRNGSFYGCLGYPQCKNTMNLRDGAVIALNGDEERHDRDIEDREPSTIKVSGVDYDPDEWEVN